MSAFSKTSAAAKAWDSLDSAWRMAFALAWESYRAGTTAAGAVLVDRDGQAIGRGRDRVFGPDCEGILAHAPMQALAGLDPTTRHEDLILYATMEPCAMCMGAVVTATVGEVRFAANDPYQGASSFLPLNPHAARIDTVVTGPRTDEFATFASALKVELYLRLNPGGNVVGAFRGLDPRATEVAKRLKHDQVLVRESRKGSSIATVVDSVWSYLTS